MMRRRWSEVKKDSMMVKGIWMIGLLVASVATVGFYARWSRRAPRDAVGLIHQTQNLNSDTLRLFVLGDSGSGLPAQGRVARAMEDYCKKSPPDALIFLGDNFYMQGVASVDDPLWQDRMVSMYSGPCLGEVPIYPVLGNHDYGLDPGAQIRMTNRWPRWRFPRRFYQITFGNIATVTFYDSHILDFCFDATSCSGDFLLNAHRSAGVSWHIVAAHHPIRSRSRKSFGHRGGLKPWLLEPWVCDYADISLAGHSHHLEYQKAPCGLHHFISGGGGADINEVGPGPGFAESSHGFLVIEMTRSQAKGQFFNDSEALLHDIDLGSPK